MNDNNQKNIIDLATAITLIGIFMFFVGCLYLRAFYTYLNIPSGFVELDFQRTLITSWSLIFQIFLGFIHSFWWAFYRNKDERFLYIGPLIFIFGTSLSMILFNLTLYNYISKTAFVVIVIALIIVSIIINKIYPKDDKIEKGVYIYFIIAVIAIVNFVSYSQIGKMDAIEVLANYEEDIEITLNHDNQVIYGNFVSFMNNKYIIIIENDKCKKEPLIINNEEVYHIKLIATRNK